MSLLPSSLSWLPWCDVGCLPRLSPPSFPHYFTCLLLATSLASGTRTLPLLSLLAVTTVLRALRTVYPTATLLPCYFTSNLLSSYIPTSTFSSYRVSRYRRRCPAVLTAKLSPLLPSPSASERVTSYCYYRLCSPSLCSKVLGDISILPL